MQKTMYVLILLGAMTGIGFAAIQPANTAPVVKLLQPLPTTPIKAGALVRYGIEVADKEDGHTKYEEIPTTEVYLTVQALANETDQKNWLETERHNEPTLRLMKQQICFNCHAVKQKLVGPSFAEMMKKYGAAAGLPEYLAAKIINGSKGVWGDSQVMPSHPEINKAEALKIAKWIQAKGMDAGYDLVIGTEGSFTAPALPPNVRKPAYLLVPQYLDHGVGGADRKSGQQVVLIPAAR